MAKAKVTHSEDAVKVTFNGDRRNPEPSTGVIEFPGGHVEVSRCSDGTYYAHIQVVDAANVVDSRFDFQNAAEHGIRSVQEIPHGRLITHVAVRVCNQVPHFDPDR